MLQALDVPIHQEIYHDLPAIDTAVADPTKRIEYAKPKKYQATKPRIHDQQHQNCEPMFVYMHMCLYTY